MMDLLKVSKELFSMISIQNIIDILIVTYLAYKIIYWISGTQAAEVAKGVLLILLITQLSDWLGLITLSYILKNVLTAGLIVLVVVFQPELRRVLSKIGRTKYQKIKFSGVLYHLRPKIQLLQKLSKK
jgi:diadenylate cyclase